MRRFFTMSLFVLMLFTGCSFKYPLPLRQPVDNIEKVELIDTSASEYTVLHSLTGDDISGFVDRLLVLKCSKRLQPTDDFGILELHIHYSDGDVDIIGSRANGYIEDGDLHTVGWYYLEEADLYGLFSE